MYDMLDIAFRIKKEAKKQKVQLKVMLSACDLNVNFISQMSDGSVPLSTSLAKIADYLDCSVDYLLGRTNNPQAHQ